MQFITDNTRLDAQITAARYLVDKATQRKEMQDKWLDRLFYAVSGLIVGVYIAASYFLFG
jgi:hypothetical protein